MSRALTGGVLRRTAELASLQRERDLAKPKPAKKQKLEKDRTLKGQEAPPVEKPQASKCMMWRIFPDQAQKSTLQLWCETTRWIYNRGVDHLRATEAVSPKGRPDASLKGLREAAGIADARFREIAPPRMRDVPYEIRDSPLQDINKACAAMRAKEKRKRGSTRDREGKTKYKFRARKDDATSFAVRARQLNCKTERAGVWPALLGTTVRRDAMACEGGKRLPAVFAHDCRVVYKRAAKRWFLCIPVDAPETQGRAARESTGDSARACRSDCACACAQAQQQGIVAIDPGIRTFATCYDPDGELVEWGVRPRLLGWLSRKADRLERKARSQGLRGAGNARSRRRIRGVAARIRLRARDLVSELHRKLARWLCLNHQVVLLPKFSPRAIARRKDLPAGRRRAIGTRSARLLYQLGHFRFRAFLAHKARELGCELVVCDEQYTSMTCGSCGLLNRGLGASKTFACPSCGAVFDRDANAARNVLLRYLSVNDIEPEDGGSRSAGLPRPAGCCMP